RLDADLRDRLLDAIAGLRGALHGDADADTLAAAREEATAASYEAAQVLYRRGMPRIDPLRPDERARPPTVLEGDVIDDDALDEGDPELDGDAEGAVPAEALAGEVGEPVLDDGRD